MKVSKVTVVAVPAVAQQCISTAAMALNENAGAMWAVAIV
jgi:hypothetical protein